MMIEHRLAETQDGPLWREYVRLGYGKGTGYKGYRLFVQSQVTGCRVTGTTLTGLTLQFDDEQYYTWFLLRWS